MKKLVPLIAITTLLSGGALEAQQTGSAAASSTSTAKGNNWQNWAFAASAMVTAAAGIFVVTMNNGNHPSSTAH